MILLDTNVISELMRATPDPNVFAWIDGQPVSSLYTTSIVAAEILSGIEILPDGERKLALLNAAKTMFAEQFDGRILHFDHAAASHYALLFAARRRAGKRIEGFDGLIAATARAFGAAIATRNYRDFDGCGIELVDPWSAAV